MLRSLHAPSAVALALLLCTAVALPASESGLTARMIASPGLDQRCDIDAVPAATLLFPYFSSDIQIKDRGERVSGRNVTTFSITNADSAPHLARVTLWTNWALPTMSFDVHLAGYDVSVFNVFDLLTGKAFDQEVGAPQGPGPLSADNVAFPDCAPSVYRQGAFWPQFHPDLQTIFGFSFRDLENAHKGYKAVGRVWATPTPLVWARPHPVDVATGYITVDVVNRCSESFPSAAEYFLHGGRGIASNENVLLGEYLIYEPSGERVSGDTAVHIRADAAAFKPGDYTFYGRYVGGDARDGRQPLGTAFASRFITDLAFAESANTYLLVWRDTKRMPAGPLSEGEMPAWYPLGGDPILVFDEAADVVTMRLSDEAPLATQSVDMDLMGAPFAAGWLMMDLNHRASDLFGGAAQGWVTTLMAAEMRSSPSGIHIGSGCRAFRLKSPCDYR